MGYTYMPDADFLDFTPTSEVFDALVAFLSGALAEGKPIKNNETGTETTLTTPAASLVRRFDAPEVEALLASLQHRDDSVTLPFVLVGYQASGPATLMASRKAGITRMPVMILAIMPNRGIEDLDADARALDRCQDLIHQLLRIEYLHPMDVKVNPEGRGCVAYEQNPDAGSIVTSIDINYRRLDYSFYRVVV